MKSHLRFLELESEIASSGYSSVVGPPKDRDLQQIELQERLIMRIHV